MFRYYRNPLKAIVTRAKSRVLTATNNSVTNVAIRVATAANPPLRDSLPFRCSAPSPFRIWSRPLSIWSRPLFARLFSSGERRRPRIAPVRNPPTWPKLSMREPGRSP